MTHGRGLPDAAPAKDASQTLKRVWGYFGEYKWRLTLFAVLLVIGVLAGVLGPYLLGVAVDQFIDPSGAARPAWLAYCSHCLTQRRAAWPRPCWSWRGCMP